MKYAVAIAGLMLAAGLAQAQESCAGKEAEIRRQLDHAREQGNDGRIRGLETALRKMQTSCTEAGLQAEREHEIDRRTTRLLSVRLIYRRRCTMALRRRSKSANASWSRRRMSCGRC